jgi:hypothetical protein
MKTKINFCERYLFAINIYYDGVRGSVVVKALRY